MVSISRSAVIFTCRSFSGRDLRRSSVRRRRARHRIPIPPAELSASRFPLLLAVRRIGRNHLLQPLLDLLVRERVLRRGGGFGEMGQKGTGDSQTEDKNLSGGEGAEGARERGKSDPALHPGPGIITA